MKSKIILSAACGVAMSIAPLALAQNSVRVHFQPGSTGTTLNGTIVGNEYRDYVLGAQAGQTMAVSLNVTATNGNGSAFFNILPAGQDFPALYDGSTDVIAHRVGGKMLRAARGCESTYG